MPDPNPAAFDFLSTRRSRPSKTLAGPWPTAQDLKPLLTAAARVPDHGKLEPWRFVVLTGAALPRLGAETRAFGAAQGIDADKVAKAATALETSGCAVVVVTSPKPSEKVPQIEQVYSAGAVCLGLVNAALASGWGANWLSGWHSHTPDFVQAHLGLKPHETVAGIIHIGSETTAPPERPRPDIDALTTWLDQ
ncbi:nitroreductase [Alphaproteobacteria bacterium KMM 3653]|uniref:Putative NAD(P)H nitroreductase n=1 Tax=Harenicola maris TaxID=2841044 RepID=A0AAP2CQ01_9RHOB|nr:nitroreductase [Harenicola maris]